MKNADARNKVYALSGIRPEVFYHLVAMIEKGQVLHIKRMPRNKEMS